MAAQDPYIKPGVDNKTHDKNMAGNVAANLSEALGAPVTTAQVTPPASQRITIDEHESAPDRADDPFDIEDIMAGEKGRPRTEASKGFLKRLLGRIRKQHPDDKIGVVNNGD